MGCDLNRAWGVLWGRAMGNVVGGGSFHLGPEQNADDTQMAVCLAESLAT